MIKHWLRRWLDRRQKNEAQVVIDQLRDRVEALEEAFGPIVAMFPEEISCEPGVRYQVGQFTGWELYKARGVLLWHELDIPDDEP